MESQAAWVACDWWWNRRSPHPFLEHAYALALALSGYRQPGVQLDVQQEFVGARVDPWLLIQPNHFVEVPHNEEDLNLNGAHPASAIPGHVSMWREHCDRSW